MAYYAVRARVVYRTRSAFSLPKDKLPTYSLSNVVYLYEFRQCESRYVGRTAPRVRKRGRPPKKRENPAEEYQSAIACHLVANEQCCRHYTDSDFSILARAPTKRHLHVLESVFIHILQPVLCKQKSFVMDFKVVSQRLVRMVCFVALIVTCMHMSVCTSLLFMSSHIHTIYTNLVLHKFNILACSF